MRFYVYIFHIFKTVCHVIYHFASVHSLCEKAHAQLPVSSTLSTLPRCVALGLLGEARKALSHGGSVLVKRLSIVSSCLFTMK